MKLAFYIIRPFYQAFVYKITNEPYASSNNKNTDKAMTTDLRTN